MTDSNPGTDGGQNIDLDALLRLLQFDCDGNTEQVSVCWQRDQGVPTKGPWTSQVLHPSKAQEFVERTRDARDGVWFGVCPVKQTVARGRGTEADVVRLSALWADVDIKDGGWCPDADAAISLVEGLTDAIGAPPTVVTRSGHGLQPIWSLDKTSAMSLEYPGEAKRLLVRWGNLVKQVAAELGYKTDGVFDLARVLRVPGSVNSKDPDHPVTVVCEQISDTILTVEGLRTRLDALNIPEVLTKTKTTTAGNGHHPPPGAGWQDYFDIDALTARVQKATEGNRNTTLFGAAKDAARQGEPERSFRKIKQAAERMADPLPDDEIELTISQGRTAGEAEREGEPPEEEQPFDSDPIPLVLRRAVPPFPVECLPGPMADMVTGLAEATQTDPAMAGTSALSVLSACCGGHAVIEVRSGWREPLNEYFATIADPAERKSAVQSAMTRPLLSAEQRLAAHGAIERMQAEVRRMVAEQAAEANRRTAARSAGGENADADMEVALAAAQFAESIQVPPVPRLIADDVTPEAAASLLAEQGGRLAIISAEGGIFDIIGGRYNANVPNLDLWLKGHSGDPLRVDRKGRAPEHIPAPALTLGLMFQPSVLNTIAANPQFRGRGLLARFLYSRPPSKVGRRNPDPAPMDRDAVTAYEAHVGALVAGLAEWNSDPAVLVLTDEARLEMVNLLAEVEPTLVGDGELSTLRDWGGKYAGAVARIAGMLHLGSHGAEQGPRTPVEQDTISDAKEFGEYFQACAINAFAEMRSDPGIDDAVYLLERIVSLDGSKMSERDLFTACSRSRFKKVRDMESALKRLEDHNLIAWLPIAKSAVGRPASRRFTVHPLAAEAAQHTKAGAL